MSHCNLPNRCSPPRRCRWGTLWYNVFDLIALFVFAGTQFMSCERPSDSVDLVPAFSAFRVWAIWGRDLRPFLFVLPFTLVTPCLNAVSENLCSPDQQLTMPPSVSCRCPARLVRDQPAPTAVWRLCSRLRYTPSCVHQVRFVTLRVYETADSCSDVSLEPARSGFSGLIGLSVADIVRGIAIATDGLVLVMTWLRTRGIYRAAIKINTRPSISSLLLRDGKCRCYIRAVDRDPQ